MPSHTKKAKLRAVAVASMAVARAPVQKMKAPGAVVRTMNCGVGTKPSTVPSHTKKAKLRAIAAATAAVASVAVASAAGVRTTKAPEAKSALMGVDYLISQAAAAAEIRLARKMHMTRAQLEAVAADNKTCENKLASAN